MNCLYENDTRISGSISVRWTESMWLSSFSPNLIKNDGQKTMKTMRVNVNKEVVMLLLLLLLSCFSRVWLCATPQTAAHQAPPSLGFSRQEHWGGLPFPSPMHESEVKVKSLTRVRLFATPWTATYQALPSMGFSREEC